MHKLALPFALASIFAGCTAQQPVEPQPVVASNPGTVYAQLSGTIDAQTIDPARHVRIALAWFRAVAGPTGTDEGGDRVMVTDDVALVSAVPGTFSLDVTKLPPADAMNGGTANAELVVYEDANGNGKLDFTQPSDHAFRDHLIGSLDTSLGHGLSLISIVYSETDGFSIVRGDWKADGSVETTTLPTSTPLAIVTTTDPAASCFLIDPQPTKLPSGRVTLGYEESYCAGSTAPAGSSLSCAPYTGAEFYEAHTPVATSAELTALCGEAVKICAIPGPAPAELGCR